MNNKKYWKVFLILLAACIMLSGDVYTKTMVIPESTQVYVRFDPNMIISSGKLQPGIPLLIYLDKPIVIAGEVLVEAGAQGKAEVLEVKANSTPGKPGSIKVGFTEISPKGAFTTSEGGSIKLTGEYEATGKKQKLLSYIFIFGLFIKGTQAKINTNAVYEAYIKETVIMQSEE
jgi:hypothetical protein